MRTAAAVMAAMLAGTACAPLAAAVNPDALPAATASGTSAAKKEDASMKAALTEVKKRIDIPEELSEFTYAESKVYSKTGYNFNWNTPADAKESKSINVSIIGNVITEFSRYGFDENVYGEIRLAKLSQEEIIAKAKENLKKLNPHIYSECKFELKNLSLSSRAAVVRVTRNVNGIDVTDNNGLIRINQDTGEMTEMSLTWWDGASFSDPKTAKTEAGIQEAYKSLCTLKPYYRISYEWNEKEKKSKPVVRIVYEPDFSSEIDAYTGKASTIWEDMKTAGGEHYYGNNKVTYANPATGIGFDYEEAAEAEADDDAGGVVFSEAEKEKLEQNENLLKTDEVTALLKKDKFVALTDSYKLRNYSVSSEKDDNGKETFTMYAEYELEKSKATAKDGYKYVNVRINAETGEVLYISKYGNQNYSEMPKLDVKKANTVAEEVAKTYAKDIVSQYKAEKSNTDPVIVWTDSKNNERFSTDRRFVFSRFVNGIQVSNNEISVTVDSNNVVTNYSTRHTENITFPDADIISTDEAFKKLYEQRDFNKYYNGWITKDGVFKTYLLYDIDGFYINAKTGKLCNWDGDTVKASGSGDVSYSDIKDIPQREAILELQKYGVTLSADGKKFRPNDAISEADFGNLLAAALNGAYAYYDIPDVEEVADEALAKDVAETTRKEAAVMFTNIYDNNGIAELKGIYRSFYSDVKTDDENAGHIAIAYGKGFFGKTADGQFHGDKVITRAEAMQLVYDYLKLLSK